MEKAKIQEKPSRSVSRKEKREGDCGAQICRREI